MTNTTRDRALDSFPTPLTRETFALLQSVILRCVLFFFFFLAPSFFST